MICKRFPPPCRLPFHVIDCFLWCTETFKFDVVPFVYFCLCYLWFWCHNPESESESHSVVSDSLRLHGLYSPWHSLGQNTGVGSLSLLQGISPTQGSNPGILHYRQILYQLSHKGSSRILQWVAYPFSKGSSWPRLELGSPALQADSLPTELSGKPRNHCQIQCHEAFPLYFLLGSYSFRSYI